jgi:DUF1365 family protein
MSAQGARTPALRLWRGHTVHARKERFANVFRYGIALVDVDVDRWDEAGRVSHHFGTDRKALFWLRGADHGPRTGTGDLRAWAQEQMGRAGVAVPVGLRLVTFPRHLGYRFAPISLWQGFDAEGRLSGILYEVNNTFGETHTYAAAVTHPRAQHEADKVFHVSPFFDVSGTYRFTVRDPAERLSLVVETLKDGAVVHMANILARPVAVSDSELLRLALSRPFASLGVSLAIHWEALKLVLKGARYHRRPALPDTPVTLAQPGISARKSSS